MMKNSICKKPVVAFVVVSILLSMGITAFANEADKDNYKKIVLNKCNKDNFVQKKFEGILEDLVKEKEITKERSREINEQFNKEYNQEKRGSCCKGANKKYKGHRIYSIINILNEKKVITDKEANAMKDRIKGFKKQKLNQALEELVNKNIITETKSKEIQEYIDKYKAEKFNKFKDMTREEKRLYFKENRKNKKSVINKMIEDNIISEKQGNEMRKILRKNRSGK